MRYRGQILCGSKQRQLAESCGHDNETSGTVNMSDLMLT